jgi:arabinan endo-1,5-alpha-L-arabinosidase
MVQAKVKVNLPPEGCSYNFVQAGLVIYGNDDNYLKLVHVSIFNTRQTEWAKEVGPVVPTDYSRYGNTVVGPPRAWTYLRIVKRTVTGGPTGLYGGTERYTAYTSRDGVVWRKGGSWTHHLGSTARIGLVSMGGSGFRADFDWVRVYRLG